MKYEEFKERIVTELLEKLPEVSAKLERVVKVNRAEDVLLVASKDSTGEAFVSLCFWLNDIYEPTADDLNEIIDGIVQSIKANFPKDCNNWIDIVSSADKIKNLVYPSMVNAERNYEYLKAHPHKEFLDLI